MVRQRSRWLIVALAAVAGLVALASGCGSGSSSSSSGGGGGRHLSLVAYSTPREVYAKLIPAFQATPDGKGVSFDQSYGPSGDQRRSVVAGLPADVVAFSLAPDVTALVKKGIVPKGWDATPYKGMVANSVVALVVRAGNPKHITGWNDLVKPGVQVITPNPFTSGGAKWNILAAYGSQLAQGKTSREALAFVGALFKNVPVQNKSAREALQTFTSGKGDVLISYENEAILAKKQSPDLQYFVPDQTLLIENPIAATTRNPALANRFIRFATSPAAQRIWGQNGYRPVDPAVAKEFTFPKPKALQTIGQLGGWDKLDPEFFDPQNGAIAKIFAGEGIPTG